MGQTVPMDPIDLLSPMNPRGSFGSMSQVQVGPMCSIGQ